jgi:hypothetical protein
MHGCNHEEQLTKLIGIDDDDVASRAKDRGQQKY